MSRINIALITDADYLLTTVVAVRSLIHHTSIDKFYALYIIGEKDVESAWKERFEYDFGPNIEVRFIEAKIEYNDFQSVHFYVSKTALLKFQLPNLLPQLDKVLYIDGDILIRQDIAELYDISVDDYYAAAIKDMLTYESDHLKYLKIDDYFNSGVMLLNLKALRENNASEELWDYKRNQTKHDFMDQDAFNMIFNRKVLFLSPKFNLITECQKKYSNSEIASFYGVTEDNLTNPVIIHMAGPDKPWKEYENNMYIEWFSYLKNSEEIAKCLREYLRGIKRKFDDTNNALKNSIGNHEQEIQICNQKIDQINGRIDQINYRIESELSLSHKRCNELNEKLLSLEQKCEELNRVTNSRIEGCERETTELKRRIDLLERTFFRRLVRKIKSIVKK